MTQWPSRTSRGAAAPSCVWFTMMKSILSLLLAALALSSVSGFGVHTPVFGQQTVSESEWKIVTDGAASVMLHALESRVFVWMVLGLNSVSHPHSHYAVRLERLRHGNASARV